MKNLQETIVTIFHRFFLAGFIFSSPLAADPNLGLPPVPIPADNLQTTQKIELGRLLFNDSRFSIDGTVSCATCHRAERAFTDGLPKAKGVNSAIGTRNTPTLINVAYFQTLFLDGRRKNLENQALDPFVNQIEHGLINHRQIVSVIDKDTNYQERFRRVFNLAAKVISIDHVVRAIASYERTLIAGNTPFDRYLFGRDKTALSNSAARGLRVFRRKGNCANCHEISWDNALLTDNRFYNIGVGSKFLAPVLDALTAAIKAGVNADDFPLTDLQRSELGRYNVTRNVTDIGQFKTPTLRNIELTSPYMHDGSMQTLEQVVEYYNQGGDNNRFIDAAIFPLHLSNQEKADLVAFMKSLTSP